MKKTAVQIAIENVDQCLNIEFLIMMCIASVMIMLLGLIIENVKILLVFFVIFVVTLISIVFNSNEL